MDVITIFIATSVVFPLLLTLGVGIYVKYTIKERRLEKQAKSRLFDLMEKTIEVQERTIEAQS